MRIAVFGASGKTGRLVIEQGLERGHEMVAFCGTRLGSKGRRSGSRSSRATPETPTTSSPRCGGATPRSR